MIFICKIIFHFSIIFIANEKKKKTNTFFLQMPNWHFFAKNSNQMKYASYIQIFQIGKNLAFVIFDNFDFFFFFFSLSKNFKLLAGFLFSITVYHLFFFSFFFYVSLKFYASQYRNEMIFLEHNFFMVFSFLYYFLCFYVIYTIPLNKFKG